MYVCVFVCYRVGIVSMHVHFSICVYLQFTKFVFIFIWRIHYLYGVFIAYIGINVFVCLFLICIC